MGAAARRRTFWWQRAILTAAALATAAFQAPPTVAGDVQRNAVPIRGVVRAVAQATLTTEVPLLVVEVPFREGDSFKQGDLLAAFDCRRQQAEHDSAVAVQREAVLNLETSQLLDRYKAVGKNEVEIASARAARARSDLQGLNARLDECRFLAPFNGRVVEIGVRKHERTVPQRPYLSIIDDGRLEIETIVPSDMLAVLRPGVEFTFRIDELGGPIAAARVSSVAAAVDPVSKTVKVIGSIEQPVAGLLAGMSGTALFKAER